MAKKNKRLREDEIWDQISDSNYEQYLGGKTGNKKGYVFLSDIRKKEEEERKRQEEILLNRSKEEWKQRRDESNKKLQESQDVLTKKLAENNINAKVPGKNAVAKIDYTNQLEVGKPKKFDNNQLLENAENENRLVNYMKTDEYKNLRKNIVENWDERAYNISGYETKKARDDSKELSKLSKILMAPVQGATSVFSGLRGDLTTENGRLQSYNEKILEENRNSLDTWVGKTAYGALTEIGKQTVVQALNHLLPGSGTFSYFGDIAEDQYNSAVLQGYTPEQARNYALLSTEAEIVFERFLGAGSNFFGKKMGAENVISGILSKSIKNKTVNDLVSSFLSEGSEEFLEEYIGEFNRQLTLDNKIDMGKVFLEEGRLQNAFDSFIIGGITGAYGQAIQSTLSTKNQRNVDQVLYDLQRQGIKLSKQNENMLKNMSYVAELTGKTLSPEELINGMNRYRNAQVELFQDNAVGKFTTLDENSRPLYNNLISDVSDFIRNTGTNVMFDSEQQTLAEWDNGTLVLNPTLTDMPIKTVLLKELSTKSLDNSTKKYILSYLKKNKVYDTLKQELMGAGEFDEANVDNEIVARELNSIFEDQNKLNELISNNKDSKNIIKNLVDNLVATVGNRETKDAMFLRNLGNKLNIADKIDLLNVKEMSKNNQTIKYKSDDIKTKMQTLSKILNRSGINEYKFTNNKALSDSGITVENRNINGYYENGKIVINVESGKEFNTIVGHELTHSLENSKFYDEFKDAIFEYAKKSGVFDEYESKMNELYEKVDKFDIEKELTAELAGDLIYTDKDFVNDLAHNHKSLFEKIFDFIKNLYFRLRGNKEQIELDNKLKNAYELYKKAFDDVSETGNVKKGNRELSLDYDIDINKATPDITIDENGMAIVDGIPEKEYIGINSTFPTGENAYTRPLNEYKSKENYGKDNDGFKLSEKVLERNKNSRTVDYNGALLRLMHTNKYISFPFTEFNPVEATKKTDEKYKYGENSIIFLTPSALMSASYGVGLTSSPWGTQRTYNAWHDPKPYINDLNSENDVKEFFKTTNLLYPDKILSVKKLKNGSYEVKQERNKLLTKANELYEKYSYMKLAESYIEKTIDSRFDDYDDYDWDSSKILDDSFMKDVKKRANDDYKKLIKEEGENIASANIYNRTVDALNEVEKIFKTLSIEDRIILYNFIRYNGTYQKNFETKTFKYENEKELAKKIKWDLGNFNKEDTYIYEVYANVTNPFIYDFDETWWANGDNSLGIPKTTADKVMNEFTKDDKQIKELKETVKEIYNKSLISENPEDIFRAEISDKIIPVVKERLNIDSLTYRYHGKVSTEQEVIDDIADELFSLTKYSINNPNFTDAEYNETIKNGFANLETNDIVKYVLELNKNGANYDGVIMKNVQDYGGQDLPNNFVPYNDLIVAFNSNQVKSVYNENPSESPNIDMSLSNINEERTSKGNFSVYGDDFIVEELQNKDLKKGDYIEPTTPINENSKKGKHYLKQISKDKSLSKTVSKNYTSFVDKLHPIQELADISGNKQLYAKFNNIGMANGTAQYQIGTAQTDLNGKEIGKSINEIWKPIEDAKLVNEFDDYLAHRLNVERYNKVPVWDETITPEISQEIVNEYEEKYPLFKNVASDIYKFNDNELQKMIESGIAKENARDWLYDNYITISRDMGPRTNPLIQKRTGLQTNSPIRRAKGGDLPIRPMKESMNRQTILTERSIASNIAGLELLNVLGGTVGDKSSLKSLDIEGENNALIDNKDGTYSYTVYKNGTPVTMQITKEIADAIRPTKIGEWENLLPFKAVRGVSKLQRALLTDRNPLFILTNFFKDIGDAPLNSKFSAGEFYATYPRAIAEMLGKSDLWKQYVARGGKENTYFDTKKGEIKEPNNVLLKGGKKLFDIVENMNQFIEQAPRFTEFLLTLDKGGTIDEAIYNSAEVTTNFARGGEITKILNRNGFNFLNASVQGFDKQIRNFTTQPGAKAYIKLLTKVAVLGIAPAMLNHLILGDDDDYEELPDYVKDNYYLFKTEDDKFVRIPKGRVMAIFGTAARHTYEMSQGREDLFSGVKDTGTQLLNNVAPNNPLENNILSPLISVKNNKSWNGSAIVSTRLQKFKASEQYDEKTSGIAKAIANSWIGKTFDFSPKKVDYLLDQYTGAIGDIVLPMTTPAAESDVKNPLLAPFVSKFTVDSTINNKYVNEYYDTKEKLEKDLSSYSSIEESQESFEKSLQYKYLDTVGKEISQLYVDKRNIQNSNLDDKEKYNKARQIQRKIDDLAKFALQDYNTGYYSDTYAVVGDKEFITKLYNGKLTWSNVDEKTKKKQEEYSNKYDMTPDDYYSMDGLTKSAIVGSNIYDYAEINSKLTEIRDNTTEDKDETFKYINGLNLSIPQKAMYLRMYYKSYNTYNSEIFNYVNSLDMIPEQKKAILIKLGFDYDKKNKTFNWK